MKYTQVAKFMVHAQNHLKPKTYKLEDTVSRPSSKDQYLSKFLHREGDGNTQEHIACFVFLPVLFLIVNFQKSMDRKDHASCLFSFYYQLSRIAGTYQKKSFSIKNIFPIGPRDL